MAVARVVAPLKTAFPKLTAKLTGTHGGPDMPWYQLLRAFWLRTGADQGVDAQSTADDVAGLDVLAAIAGAPAPTPMPPLPVAVTVGVSPFSYQAPWSGVVVISGGTVSAVAFSRDGATFFAYPTAGPIPVFVGDVVKVTHTGAPTMTMVPL